MQLTVWKPIFLLFGFLALALALFAFAPNISPTGAALQDGTIALLNVFNFHRGTLGALILFMCALILALFRHSQIIKLQTSLLSQQKRDLDFFSLIMNEHSIASETDADGIFTDVSEKFEKLFGYTREELIGQSANILYEDDRDDKHNFGVHQTLTNGKIYVGEQRLRTKSGKFVITQSTLVPFFDENGLHQKNISIRTDVTELRNSEADHYLTALLKKLQDEVYIYSVDTFEIQFMNDLALERCGWTSEVALTHKMQDCASGLDAEFFKKHVRPILGGEKKSVVVQAKFDKQHVEIVTRLHVRLDTVPIFVSVVRDISGRKKIESDKLKIVTDVSHELRTPLTSIKGALRLLKSGAAGSLSTEVASMVDIADRNSERMLLVLNDILDLEKIEAGKMNFNLKKMSLATLVEDAVKMNQGYGDQFNVTFVADQLNSSAYVVGDANRLMQVMSNLMSNAAKFSPDDGQVTIALTELENKWCISVSDKGPGIPERDYGKIFASFTQLEPVDGKLRGGTGLGLTISKKIVEQHSGTIDFDSTVGVGTTFFFNLPKITTNPDAKTANSTTIPSVEPAKAESE